MKFLRVLCVAAIAVCLAATVYAETQSVKVSGDLTMRGIYRYAYDYQGSPNEGAGVMGNVDSGNQSWFMTVAEVEVDADLTDNVSTVIRLLNQRDWNVYTRSIQDGTTLAPNGRGGYAANTDEFNVMVDLAYVTLKDFIYSPLTLTIGRQDLWFGKGFIVGANLQNPGIGTGTAQGNLISSAGNLSAPEYTAVWSFDSIKAVLDYDPWTISGIYSKIFEDAIQANDDVDLWGINVGYKFDAYRGEAEGYWFAKIDNSAGELSAIKHGSDVHTLGLRGSFDPIDVITISAEGAYQAGQYVGSRLQAVSRDRSAWALDVGGECRYFMERFAWKPKFGIEYIYYSGNKTESNANVGGATYHGWDPMFRGKFDSAIREWVGKYYASSRYPVDATRMQSCADDSRTNQHQLILVGGIQPIDSLSLKLNYNIFWNQERYLVENSKTKGLIGQEVDVTANWDYTEDVSFGLLAAWFIPGQVYYDNRSDIASDVVGTVKVSF